MTTPIEPSPQRWSPSVDPTSIVVPGLDTNAPTNDQIDQIEQLITIKLQNIDANFSKIQHLMATRLLPAVKRYAVGTEPVREAAKFWTSFYEQAAQVHIPTLDDDDFVNDEQTQPSVVPSESECASVVSQTEDDIDVTPSRTATSQTGMKTYDMTASESSFMPSNAVSSTPARPGHAGDRTADEHPSWSSSLESPMVRLNRELQSFARETEEETSVAQDVSNVSDSFAYEEENTIQQPQLITQEEAKAGTGPSRVGREPYNTNVQPSLPRSAMPTPRATSGYISPLNVKPKTPIAIPKHLQSYLPPKLDHEPVFPSPRRQKYERTPRKPAPPSSSSFSSASTSTSRSVSRSSLVLDLPSLTKHTSDANPETKFTEFNDSFDDSVDLMQGMSPPRTMAFARAPRSSMGLGLLQPLGRTPGRDLVPSLGRTPGKEAANRIRRDLLGDMQSQFGSANTSAANRRTPGFGYGTGAVKDDTMSTIPTPPSLSRYTRHQYQSWTDTNDTDASLATMMRRVGLDVPESSFKSGSVASASHSRSEMRGDVTGDTLAPPPLGRDELHTPDHQTEDVFDLHQDEQSAIQLGSHPRRMSDSDSDSDSLNDEPAHLGQPSTAFLMASNRDPDPDDSFGSSNSNHSSDSLGADELAGGDGAAVHPFARALEAGAGDGFDDSFESDGGFDAEQPEGDESVVEETVFGIPPAQRGGAQSVRGQGQLRLLGEDLLQDTIGIGEHFAKVGRIEESPTPYGRG